MLFRRSKAKKAKPGEAEAVPDAKDIEEQADPRLGSRLLLADLALQGGTFLLRQGIERGLLGRKLPTGKALKKAKGLGRGGSLAHVEIVRLATRSVSGAILVGGGLLAKMLHDRRKAAKPVELQVEQARDGEDGAEEA
jgi:uncharacterized membrane protein